MIYVEFLGRGAGAEQIFEEFEQLMRNRQEEGLERIFSTSIHPENSQALIQIREFSQYKAEDIRTELASLTDIGVGKWILDLTNTALFMLLANWGLEFEQVTAICDNSKPLLHQQSFYDVMINREDRHFSHAFCGESPITFNLSGPIEFADSKITHGVQIADAISAAAVYALGSSPDDHSEKWKNFIPEIGHYGSIFPELDKLNLRDRATQRNAVLLMELHSRAKKGQSLIEGMPEYIALITRRLITHPLKMQ